MKPNKTPLLELVVSVDLRVPTREERRPQGQHAMQHKLPLNPQQRNQSHQVQRRNADDVDSGKRNQDSKILRR